MLTPPKWQTVWLKSQYSSRNISKKIMFANPADKILDDISKCCNSTSKELTLEALNCWRIWIDNQQTDDWKQNETCYSVVRPLRTKKFHPLHKDSEVSEIKLSLLWLALQKIQYLMHFEGPQHVLEVFIQSCLSWLSCSEVDSNIHNLILKLLSSLFSKDIKIVEKEDIFPPLGNDVLQSNKLFCRLLNSFMEIFCNWTKIKEKTDLLFIWNHFLDRCEESFKFIPVAAWHKIFKLVETVCADEKELIGNKMALLHKYATSLKSVMSNSKFIDCSQLLTTPAEALLKIVVELSVKNRDENITFQIFKYCQEICHVLSSHIIHTFGYESCVHVLSKIEDIDSKSLLWGLWCGLAECFGEKVVALNLEQYSKSEMKLFRKLRSIAVNFDLDAELLEERSVSAIQIQLKFLRVGKTCENCRGKGEKMDVDEADEGDHSSGMTVSETQVVDGSGKFGVDFGNPETQTGTECESTISHASDDSTEKDTPREGVGIVIDAACHEHNSKLDAKASHDHLGAFRNGQFGVNPNDNSAKVKPSNEQDRRWMRFSSNAKTLNLHCNFMFLCDTLQQERLITVNCDGRRGILVAPVCLTLILDELCARSRKLGDLTTHNFIENVKKVENKVREGQIFGPMKFYVSFRGRKGLELYSDTVRFWYLVNEIVWDADFEKDVKVRIARSDKSILWLCMFLFLVNFAKNSFLESSESAARERRKPFLEDEMREMLLSLRMMSFMKKVIHCRERLSRSAFLDSLNDIVPRNCDNPVLLWTKCATLRNARRQEDGWEGAQTSLRDAKTHTEPNGRGSNDNLVSIFNYFNDLQNEISKEPRPFESADKRKETADASRSAKRSQRLRSLRSRHSAPDPHRTEQNLVEIAETTKVRVLQAPPDVFRSLTFSEWKPEASYPAVRDETRSVPDEPCDVTANECNNDRVCGDLFEDVENEIAAPRRSKRQSVESGNRKRTIKSRDGVNAECKRRRKSEPAGGCQVSPSPCRTSKENISAECTYSLRQRPLRQPSKFKEMKCLLGDCFGERKGSVKSSENGDKDVSSPSKPATVLEGCAASADDNVNGSEQAEVPDCETHDSNGDVDISGRELVKEVAPPSVEEPDNANCPNVKILTNFKQEICDEDTPADESSIRDGAVDGFLVKLEQPPNVKYSEDDESVDFKAIISVTAKTEAFDSDESKADPTLWSSPVSTTVKIECTARGIKRRGLPLDGTETPKRIKLELGLREELLEGVVVKLRPEDDVEEPAESDAVEEEEPSTANATKAPCQKSDVPVAQSRGSRMLALIPESPKINRFHDSSPSSKHHAIKPPNVVKNSRASKMLALLPELQETSSASGAHPVGDGSAGDNPLRDELVGRGISGIASGKMHHLLPNGSPVSALSPKRSPIRQRKSIRFDDDRNETVTYYTDSPPCLTVVQGLRFKGIEK